MGLQYEADGPQDIGIQFSKEGDAMARNGFQEPHFFDEAPDYSYDKSERGPQEVEPITGPQEITKLQI